MMAVRSLSVRPGAAARGDTAPPAARATAHASSPGLRRQDAPTSSSASSRVRALLLARRAGVAAAAAAVAAAVHPHQLLRTLTGGGGAGGSGAGGGSGGSGGGGGGHGRWFGEQAAWAESDYFDEDDDDSRRGPKAPGTPAAASPDDEEKFLCEAVKANNLPTGPGIPSKVSALAEGWIHTHGSARCGTRGTAQAAAPRHRTRPCSARAPGGCGGQRAARSPAHAAECRRQ